MRIMRLLSTSIVSTALLFFCCGFDGCFPDNSPTQTGGFPVQSYDAVDLGFSTIDVPHKGAVIVGNWLQDDSNATGTTKSFGPITTDGSGLGYVVGGRYYADWQSTVRWNPFCVTPDLVTQTEYFINVDPNLGIGWECIHPGSTIGPSDSHFALQNTLPSSFVVDAYSGKTLDQNAPTSLYVYSRSGSPLNTISATSVASDGTSATFPFPTNSNGSALPPDIYGLSMLQNDSDVDGLQWIAIGGENTSFNQPFGVAVSGQTRTQQSCKWYPGPRLICGPETTTYSATPVVTLYSQNQVVIGSTTVTVGLDPTAVATYNGGEVDEGWSPNTDTYSGDTRAVVADSGTNLVSIVDVVNDSLLQNVTVGNQPVALVLSPDETKAYVANYGSGTVSVVDLASATVLNTISVGGNPLSVALDNNGNLWVGETNALIRVDLTSNAVAQTIQMSGPVTSLAYSNGESELLSTIQQSNNSIQANTYSSSNLLSSSNNPSPYLSSPAGYTTDYTAAATTLTNIPNPQLLTSATLVSNDRQNTLTVSATSTGFVVTDLSTGDVIMQGTTPGPVRSIAVDKQNQVAYMTVPSANLLINVPLPPVTLK